MLLEIEVIIIQRMLRSFPLKRIAIDIDEVLCPFLHPMAKRYDRMPPNHNHPYDYTKALGITSEESKMMVSSFYHTKTFHDLKPIEESQNYIRRLRKNGYMLYAMTGRQSEARSGTEWWLDNQFPHMFHDLIITNSYTDYEISKSFLCMSLNISVIVDDNFQTCIDCKDHGVEAINYVGDPMYNWCVDSTMAARNWEDVYKKITFS